MTVALGCGLAVTIVLVIAIVIACRRRRKYVLWYPPLACNMAILIVVFAILGLKRNPTSHIVIYEFLAFVGYKHSHSHYCDK